MCMPTDVFLYGLSMSAVYLCDHRKCYFFLIQLLAYKCFSSASYFNLAIVDEHTCAAVLVAQPALILAQPLIRLCPSVSVSLQHCREGTAASPAAPQASWLRQREKRRSGPAVPPEGPFLRAHAAPCRGSRPGPSAPPAASPLHPAPSQPPASAAAWEPGSRAAPAPSLPSTGGFNPPDGPPPFCLVPLGQRRHRTGAAEGGARASIHGLCLSLKLLLLLPTLLPCPLPQQPGLPVGSGEGRELGCSPEFAAAVVPWSRRHRESTTAGQYDQRPNSHKRKQYP